MASLGSVRSKTWRRWNSKQRELEHIKWEQIIIYISFTVIDVLYVAIHNILNKLLRFTLRTVLFGSGNALFLPHSGMFLAS